MYYISFVLYYMKDLPKCRGIFIVHVHRQCIKGRIGINTSTVDTPEHADSNSHALMLTEMYSHR